jgi:hypothetical protein
MASKLQYKTTTMKENKKQKHNHSVGVSWKRSVSQLVRQAPLGANSYDNTSSKCPFFIFSQNITAQAEHAY